MAKATDLSLSRSTGEGCDPELLPLKHCLVEGRRRQQHWWEAAQRPEGQGQRRTARVNEMTPREPGGKDSSRSGPSHLALCHGCDSPHAVHSACLVAPEPLPLCTHQCVCLTLWTGVRGQYSTVVGTQALQQTDLVLPSERLHTACVTLGKTLHLSQPWFPLLWNKETVSLTSQDQYNELIRVEVCRTGPDTE